jgi:serine/threonine protein kinase
VRKISGGLRNILMRMLDKDPLKRASVQELRENEWINEGCRTKLNAEEYIITI